MAEVDAGGLGVGGGREGEVGFGFAFVFLEEFELGAESVEVG